MLQTAVQGHCLNKILSKEQNYDFNYKISNEKKK